MSSAAFANPCVTKDGFLDSGIGGTGLSGGIGGTGEKRTDNASNGQSEEDDNGIGGTGVIDTNGIGGTGIRAAENSLIFVTGTIHGFGSICVNGVEIEYAADTPVDSGPAGIQTASSLSIGQVVDIVAQRKPGQAMPEAKTIAVRYPAEGRVTKISPDGRSFTVMDKPVRALDPKAVGQVRVGDVVRVSGLENPHGEVMASFVQKLAPEIPLRKTDAAPKPLPQRTTAVSVQGYVASVTPEGAVSMNGQTFHFGTTAEKLRVGTRIILSGRMRKDGSVNVTRWIHERHPVGTKYESSAQTGSNDGDSHNSGRRSDDDDDLEDHDEDRDDKDHSGHGRGGDTEEGDSGREYEDQRGKIDGSGRNDMKEDRSGSSHIGEIDRPDHESDKPEASERPDHSGSEKLERPEKPDKPDKVEKIEKPDKPDKPDHSGSGRPDRPEKLDKSGKG